MPLSKLKPFENSFSGQFKDASSVGAIKYVLTLCPYVRCRRKLHPLIDGNMRFHIVSSEVSDRRGKRPKPKLDLKNYQSAFVKKNPCF